MPVTTKDKPKVKQGASPISGYAFTREDALKGLETRRKRAEARRRERMSVVDAITESAESHAQNLAKALVAKALEGDVAAHNTILDRLYGKPTQKLEVANQDPVAGLSLAEKVELLGQLRDLLARREATTIEGEIVGEIVSQSPDPGATPHNV